MTAAQCLDVVHEGSELPVRDVLVPASQGALGGFEHGGETPLDPSNIRNVFVLESTGPAHVWVDGIRLQCAFNTEPEWWQIDTTCDVAPTAPAAAP